MKCHTGVDAGSGFVHTVEAAANVHDVTVASKLLREDDEVVYGDSAYLGLEKREEIKNIVISLEKHLKERYNTGMSYPVKYRERTIEIGRAHV